ncbi:MAG: caspase family protein [Deltaproteobacteria bacterium]|nr:caspase family protein [Deltaproteobacteria bacterium]
MLLCLALAVAWPLGAADAAEARALLIGVGNPAADHWEPLSAQRDLSQLTRSLDARGVSRSTVRILDGELATADGILGAIEDHLGTAPPGSQVLLHFSGHAEQIPDDGNDEPDGLDEAWVPFGAVAGDDTSLLRDDQIGVALDAVRLALGPHGSVVVTIDACHGAGTLRGIGAHPRAHGGVLEVGEGSGFAPMVVLAATRSGSQAREITDGEGEPVGAFSAALADVLVARPVAASWGGVFERVRDRMSAVLPGARPELGGAGALAIFGGDLASGAWSLGVSGRLGDGRFVLEGGLLHGLTDGATVELHRDEGVAPSPETLIAVAQVEKAGAASALARTQSTDVDGAVSLRAFVSTPPASSLRVSLEGAAGANGLREVVEEAGVVVADTGGFVLRREDDEVRLMAVGSTEVLARSSIVEGQFTEVSAVLRRLVAARRVLEMPLADGELAVAVRLQEASAGSCEQIGSEYLAPTEAPDVAVGQTIRLEVEHRGSLPAWVTVVHVDERGFGHQLAPLSDSPLEPLQPGVSWVAPTCWTVTPPASPQTLRVLATRRPAELGALLEGETLRALPPEGYAVDIALQVRLEATK